MLIGSTSNGSRITLDSIESSLNFVSLNSFHKNKVLLLSTNFGLMKPEPMSAQKTIYSKTLSPEISTVFIFLLICNSYQRY